MNKLSQTSKLIILGVVVVVIVVLVVVYGSTRPSGSQAPAGATSTTSGVASTSLTDTGSMPAGNGNGITPLPKKTVPVVVIAPKGSVIDFLTPTAGETWHISTQNVISWEPDASVPGYIELLNAATGQFVGVVLSAIGPQQTSYTWNTRDLFENVTNPSKLTVTPGTYVFHIVFSGNDLPAITSQAITITN